MFNIWRNYKYVFYWLYTWQKNLWGKDKVPESNTALGMSLSLGCNFLSVVLILKSIFKIELFLSGIPKYEAIVYAIVVYLIHHILFIHNKRYLRIEMEFKDETRENRKRKGVWVLLYTFGSIVFYGLVLLVGIWISS
jgi:hypothetical protein